MSIDALETQLPDELLRLLRAPSPCFVSTLMPDGSPQLTETWVDTDGHNVVINIVEGSQKARNLRRDPRIAVAVADPQSPAHYIAVRGQVFDITTDGAVDHIDELAQRYTGGPYAWYGGRQQVRLKVTIEPRSITGI
jgi:PPOX class probable F420-dependent enzyme